MKWVVIFFFLPILSFSQGVKVSKYDNFIKKHRIELEPMTIHSSPGAKLSVSFTSIASNLFIEISGAGWGASTIDAGNEMIFLFTNDSTVTARSSGLQTFEPGIDRNTYKHQYFIKFEDLDAFSKYELAGIRKYSFKEFSDISIQKEYKAKLQKAGSLFIDELKKANVIKTLKQVSLKEVAAHAGDSVTFCSKVYSGRYYESSENKPTVLDVHSNFDDPLVNVIIMEEHRVNFPDNPEKIYLNKEVCVSGVVMLRNNIPYITVRNRDQIKVKSQPTLEDIALFVGDSVTVSGMIFSARYFAESNTSPTLLNMGAPFPDQPLTVVIEKADRPLFEQKPEEFYLNQEVRVSGRVVLYKNKPQIVVRSKEQLKLVNGDGRAKPDFAKNNTTSSSLIVPTKTQQTNEIPEVEVPAEFPGGNKAWVAFLRENLRIPDQMAANSSKTVIASFLVSENGKIGDVKIVKSGGDAFDMEVLRVLELMPRWKPRYKGDVPVTVTVTQPITFMQE